MARQGGVTPYRDRKGRRIGWVITWYDHSGRRRRRRLKGWSKDDARKLWLANSTRGTLEQHGVGTPAERMALQEYVERHWLPERRKEVSEDTLRGEVGIWERQMRKGLGSKRLSELDPITVRGFLQSMKQLKGKSRKKKRGRPAMVPASPQMQGRALKLLTVICRRAAQDGYFGPEFAGAGLARWSKPWLGVKPAKAPKVERARLRSPEIARVIEAARQVGGERLALAVTLGVLCGLRRGEVRKLDFGDLRPVDAQGDPVPWEDAAQVVIRVRPENAKSRTMRHVNLGHPGAVSMLRRWRSHHDALGRAGEDAPLFQLARTIAPRGEVVAEAGQRLGKLFTSKVWAKVVAVAQVDSDLRFHDLRGTFIAQVQRAGFHARVAQHLAGHVSLQTTQKSYDEVGRTDDRLDVAAKAFAQLELPEVEPPAPAERRKRQDSHDGGKGLPRTAKGRGLGGVSKGDRFGDALREARIKAGLSQQALGQHLADVAPPISPVIGKPSSWKNKVNALERGKWKAPNVDVARRLGAALANLFGVNALRFVPHEGGGGDGGGATIHRIGGVA